LPWIAKVERESPPASKSSQTLLQIFGTKRKPLVGLTGPLLTPCKTVGLSQQKEYSNNYYYYIHFVARSFSLVEGDRGAFAGGSAKKEGAR
jgi:hypothetical protein